MENQKIGKIKNDFYTLLANYLELLQEESGLDEEEIDDERQQYMKSVNLLQELHDEEEREDALFNARARTATIERLEKEIKELKGE